MATLLGTKTVVFRSVTSSGGLSTRQPASETSETITNFYD